jgi:hypothetical protein
MIIIFHKKNTQSAKHSNSGLLKLRWDKLPVISQGKKKKKKKRKAMMPILFLSTCFF